ncbi:hypothetical protein [Streptosporangium sp. NPDC048865]|uniref:hypothetical protein n=1 Tax=Streptosporangium sp. NPDC048865 TaxID=3155766 RepID=UPI00341FDCA8
MCHVEAEARIGARHPRIGALTTDGGRRDESTRLSSRLCVVPEKHVTGGVPACQDDDVIRRAYMRRKQFVNAMPAISARPAKDVSGCSVLTRRKTSVYGAKAFGPLWALRR